MSLNGFLGEVTQEGTVRDYQHASRIFRIDNFRFSPKLSFLFYVRINLNPEFTLFMGESPGVIGSLVKTVNLPKFTMDVRTMNAYNRPNLATTKIKYDPVTMKFHDDGADIVRQFWIDYYSYHFRDTDHSSGLYNAPHKYEPRPTDRWGYTLRQSYGGGGPSTMQTRTNLIDSIQIFSFNQKKFSECTLHNPIISSFQHGDHDHANGTGVLEHTMTVNYENVSYATGWCTESNFGSDMLLYYDASPSILTPLFALGAVGGTPRTNVTQDEYGRPVEVSNETTYYRGGQEYSGDTSNSGGDWSVSGVANKVSGFFSGGQNSAFSKATSSIVGAALQSAIRGRNPLSAFGAPTVTNLLYQAGGAVGGAAGQKLIAAGGLIKAGQTISKGGVGPGNLGTVAVAIRSASILTGVRPQDIFSRGPGKSATTNGQSVARSGNDSVTYSSAPNFPSARPTSAVETSKQGIFSTPSYSDGPSTINDSRDSYPDSNQGYMA